MASSAFAADATCKILADANAKIYAVPTHMYQTETAAGGKTRSNELIFLNNKTYLSANGKWIVSPRTPKDMAADQAESLAVHPNAKCSLVRDEPVNGEAATLYTMHDPTPDSKQESQLWISKSRGVPLKAEMDLDAGAGKTHRSIRYEYTNVAAPPGVR
jgi:hypothetical protein